jgi:nucleoid-associated protein YgaU
MPAGPTSRYRPLPVMLEPDAAGAWHPAIPARPVPPPTDPTATPYFHTVVAGETIELLAFRYFGSSAAWWLIADANPAAFPLDLPPGTVLAIPTDASPGRVERRRTF